MYPFTVFKLSHQTSDEEVKQRYHELIKMYPPDRHPQTFQIIREAYEKIKDESSRLKTRLFYFDKTGRSFLEESLPLFDSQERKRPNPGVLQKLFLQERTNVTNFDD